MNKAKKAIAERIKSVDMVIEMLDARMPASSENPLLAQLSKIGITYSQAVFTFDRVLTQEECDVIWDMSHMVTRYLDNLTLMYDGNIPHADAGEGIAPLK